MAWVDPSYPDPSVDYAARSMYDYAYQGTGNWPFNAAYAAHYGLDAEVVQLPSVDDLETLVKAGIPVPSPRAFDNGELTGSGYGTAGHLMVVAGFTGRRLRRRRPVLPLGRRRAPRLPAQPAGEHLAADVLDAPNGTTGSGSGGVAYVYTPHDMALPPVVDPRNPTW